MSTVCTVSGTLRNLQGETLANTVVGFSRAGVVGQYGAAVIPFDVQVTSNGSGAVSFDIYPGNYVGTAFPVSGRVEKFTMAVPEAATADLADLIGGPGEDITTGLTQIAADLEAETAARIAGDDANTEGVYPTLAAGLADTKADDYFIVPESEDYITLYQKSAGGDGNIIGQYSSRSFVDGRKSAAGTANFALGAGYEVFNPNAEGAGYIPHGNGVTVSAGEVGRPILVEKVVTTGSVQFYGIYLQIPYNDIADLDRTFRLNASVLSGEAYDRVHVLRTPGAFDAANGTLFPGVGNVGEDDLGFNIYDLIAASPYQADYEAQNELYVLLAKTDAVSANLNPITGVWSLRPLFVGGYDTIANILSAELDATLAKVSDLEDFATTSELNMTNRVENARLLDADVGLSNDPDGWTVLSGGGGTTPAAWEVAEAPMGFSDLDCNVFKSTHSYDGTLRTDRQFIAAVPIPERYQGSGKTFRAVYRVLGDDNRQNLQSYYRFRDAAGAITGASIITPTVIQGITDATSASYYVMEGVLSQAQGTQLDYALRVSSKTTEGNYSGSEVFVGLAGVYFDDVESDQFTRNFDEEIRRSASTVIAENSQAAGGELDTTSRHITAQGVSHHIHTQPFIICIGDSQTAGFGSASQSDLGGLAEYEFINWGIGSETSDEALNRMSGVSAYTVGVDFSTAGVKELRARQAVPIRTVDETHRISWEAFASRQARPSVVEFHNGDGFIGSSTKRITATATVSGAVWTSVGHTLSDGDEVYLDQDSYPGNAYRYKVYYVRDVSGDDFSLSEFSGQAAISFDVFAGEVDWIGDFVFDWDFSLDDDTKIRTVTHAPTDDYLFHICLGTNDFGLGVSSQVAFNNILKIVSQIRALKARFLISGIPGFRSADGEWGIGGVRYNKMFELLGMLQAAFPGNVIDIYSYLLTQGDGGADDTLDISEGYVPRSLRASATDGHLSFTVGSPIWQDKIVDEMRARGWVSA